MPKIFAIGDSVVYNGPVSDNTPKAGDKGIIDAFVPQGYTVSMVAGYPYTAPSTAWSKPEDYDSSQTTLLMALLLVGAGAAFFWYRSRQRAL